MGRAVGSERDDTALSKRSDDGALRWEKVALAGRTGHSEYRATSGGITYAAGKGWGATWDLIAYDETGASVRDKCVYDLPNLKTAKVAAEALAQGADARSHTLTIASEKLGGSPIRGHGSIWGGYWRCTCGAGQRRYDNRAKAAIDAWEHWRRSLLAQL